MMEKSPWSHPSISVPRHHFQGRRLKYFAYFNLLPSRYPPVKDYNIDGIIIFRSLYILVDWLGSIYLGRPVKAKINAP